MTEHSSRRYSAFISYRHLDNKKEGRRWASWLHTELEAYEIPAEFIGTRNARGAIVPKSLYPIFRDEEELRSGEELEKAIEDALKSADFLIVLCSPRSRDSTYVRQEIRCFKELGKSHCIIPVLIDGEPNAPADCAERECLPHELRFGEPDDTPVPPGYPAHINWDCPYTLLGADFRPEGANFEGYTSPAAYQYALEQEQKYTKEYLDERESRLAPISMTCRNLSIISKLVGLDLDALRDREAKRRALEAARRSCYRGTSPCGGVTAL